MVCVVAITKTIWRGKVGTRDFGACNATVSLKNVPILSIYCTVMLIIRELYLIEKRREPHLITRDVVIVGNYLRNYGGKIEMTSYVQP